MLHGMQMHGITFNFLKKPKAPIDSSTVVARKEQHSLALSALHRLPFFELFLGHLHPVGALRRDGALRHANQVWQVG